MLDTNHFSHWYWPHHGFNQIVSFKRRPLTSTLKPRQNVDRFPNDIFKCIFLNENVWISIKISLKSVPKGPNNSIPALVQIMAWRRPDDKPLFEPILVSLLTHISVTRPQWANRISKNLCTLFPVSPNGRYNHFSSVSCVWLSNRTHSVVLSIVLHIDFHCYCLQIIAGHAVLDCNPTLVIPLLKVTSKTSKA